MFKFLTLLFTLLVAVAHTEEEIRVHLTSESPLVPIYVSRLSSSNCPFNGAFLNQLDTALQFDLNYNGSTKVALRTDQKEELLRKKKLEEAFASETWKEFGLPYVIRWAIEKQTLSLTLFTTSSGSLKHFTEIPLSGDIVADRRQLHKLADVLCKVLFNQEGVANSRILYSVQIKKHTVESEQWVSEIWECDWDGANAHQVTHEGSYSVTPLLLPMNSDRFLYVSYKLGQPKIFIGSLKGGKGEPLITLRGNQFLPAISPKKDKIAFISDASGRTDLFVQAFHPNVGEVGKPVQLFSFPHSTQASPTFSPDGSKIAFVSDKDGTPRIYIIPAVATERRATAVLITKNNRENSCPAWSPDGRKLAYSAKSGGVRQIWIYDFETKVESPLTSGPGNKENPSWAPDSQHLVFNSTGGADSSELFIVNLHQPEAIKITSGPGKKHYPSWGMR